MSLDNPLNIPTVEESKIVFDEFVKIRRDRLRLPSSHVYHYYTLVTREDAVIILARTVKGELVLNEEYRHPVNAIVLGAPGGYLENDEDPVIGARRELIEETGFSANKFTLIGSTYPYPGISSQKIFYVLAQDAFQLQNSQPEQSEVIRTVVVTEKKLREDICKGACVDGTLCTALFLLSCQ